MVPRTLNYFPDLYSRASFKDAIRTKILVYSVYILQIIQIILFTKDGFAEFTADSENIPSFVQLKTSWFSVCVIQGLGMCKVLYDRLGLSNTEVS